MKVAGGSLCWVAFLGAEKASAGAFQSYKLLCSRKNYCNSQRAQMSVRYLELKDRAWSAILRSALVSDKLSSKAQRRIESEFETIKQLEYTESNIHGFLLGLAQAGSEIQIQMAIDVFDLFTAMSAITPSSTKAGSATMRIGLVPTESRQPE
ncbi:hypothetical protein CBP36_18910 (plasmid) [Acidovorax carolinensis]|uniref:DUF4942 domain-containing protein n=1 Tax=Acidovorax carolinensis TaxID=553814 RepID=A0A240UJP1_9BURK|nr:DUF4942 domain-containing protein [Acidovorax carolinensis]ART61293.1 hypothetical protein CBP36_18910 [Acidovorax carolinensis]